MGTIAAVLSGLVLLVWGGEWLVRGAERLALSFRVSPLVIGLTVVAFGTSAPELAVTTQAAYSGTDVGLGNVLGSNIFNVLAILGLAAVVAPLTVSSLLIRRDVPIMIAISSLMFVTCCDGEFSRSEGMTAVAALVAYTWWLVGQARREQSRETVLPSEPKRSTGWITNVLFIAAGLALLIVGARLLVGGAVEIARALGVSELIIGLTVVAAGTSLPEVITSVVASLRGQRDIAVGNIVGSNIFNLLCVLGVAASVAPNPIAVSEQALWFDFPVMIAVSVVCLPIFIDGLIARWEGILLLAYYVAYVTYLILDQTSSIWRADFAHAMLYFCLPLTLLTLLVLAKR